MNRHRHPRPVTNTANAAATTRNTAMNTGAVISTGAAMNARGFTLVELLVATLLLLVISGAAATLAASMRDAFERTVSAGDTVTRGRSAVEALAIDVRQAGTGLADVDAVAVPHASLTRLEIAAPFTALTVLRAAHGVRGVLRDPLTAGATTLQLEESFGCAGSDRSCGFTPGTLAAIYDGARLERVAVSGIVESASRLILSAPITTSFAAGASVVALATTTYGTRADAGGIRFVRSVTGGAEQTLIDHVVDVTFTLEGAATPPVPGARDDDPPSYGPQAPRDGADDPRDVWAAGENCTTTIDAMGTRVPRLAELSDPTRLARLTAATLRDGPWCPDATSGRRFDADLLRVRVLGISVTVEVASAVLRGPASRLFGHAGVGSRPTQWVPDLQLDAAVMLRSRR